MFRSKTFYLLDWHPSAIIDFSYSRFIANVLLARARPQVMENRRSTEQGDREELRPKALGYSGHPAPQGCSQYERKWQEIQEATQEVVTSVDNDFDPAEEGNHSDIDDPSEMVQISESEED